MPANFLISSESISCWWFGLGLLPCVASISPIRLPDVRSPYFGNRFGTFSWTALLSRPVLRLSGLLVSYCDRLRDLFIAVLVDMLAERNFRHVRFRRSGRGLLLLRHATVFSITLASKWSHRQEEEVAIVALDHRSSAKVFAVMPSLLLLENMERGHVCH